MAMVASAPGFSDELPVLELTPGTDAPRLNPYIRYLPDYRDALAYHKILPRLPEMLSRDRWEIHFGRSQGKRTLVLLAVKNAGDKEGTWLLTTGRSSLAYLQFFEISGKETVLGFSDSRQEAVSENLSKYHTFTDGFTLAPGETKILGLHFQARTNAYMPLRIYTHEGMEQSKLGRMISMVAVAAAILAIVFLNSIFYLMTSRRVFFYVSLAELLYLYVSFVGQGYSNVFLFSADQTMGQAISDLAKCAFAYFSWQFACHFLDMKNKYPRFEKFALFMMRVAAVIFVLLLLYPLLPLSFNHAVGQSTYVLILVSILALPVAGTLATVRQGLVYLPLAIAWGLLATYTFYTTIAAATGWVPIFPYQWRFMGYFGVVEAVLMTVSLGLEIRMKQQDAVQKEKDLAISLKNQLAASRKAQQMAEEKSLAIANLSDQNALMHAAGHDSRQVIFAIESAALQLEKNPQQTEPINVLKSASQYLRDVVSTTIAGARNVGHNMHVPVISEQPIRDMFQSLELIFQPAAKKKGIAFHMVGNLDQTYATDFALLNRAISNFISNAIKFTNAGSVCIAVRPSPTVLRLQIRDSGIGMRPKSVKELLQGEDWRVREHDEIDGTGSGFRIATRIAESLGGHIRLYSKPGRGTTVEIRLPCRAREAEQAVVIVAGDSEQVNHLRSLLGEGVLLMEKSSLPEQQDQALCALVDLDQIPQDSRQDTVAQLSRGNPDLPLVGITRDQSLIMRGWAEVHLDGLLIKPVGPALLAGLQYFKLGAHRPNPP